MRGIIVVFFFLLYSILYKRNIVLGDPPLEKTATNRIPESNQGDNIPEIQTRMTCSYNRKDWCQVGPYYYIPCKLPKQCPGADSKFMECINGGCHECVFQKRPCISDAECCKHRESIHDDGVIPETDSFCKFGTCSYCIRFGQKCDYLDKQGLRQACCPTKGQKDVQCRVLGLRIGSCAVDPCVTGKLPKVLAPGFVYAQPRCDSAFPTEPKGFDFQCRNTTCVQCLGYGSLCGTAQEGRDKCCDYLVCNKNRKCDFKEKCFPEDFKCRTADKCCKGLYCKIFKDEVAGACIKNEN